jgi:uncharacterized protein YgiM (DUF1202 family)
MKTYKIIGLISIISITILLLGTQPVFARTTGVISGGNNINVRERASLDSGILKTIQSGTQLEIVNSSGMFYQVNVNGTIGAFISSDFITIKTATGVVNASSVNIRENPSLTAQIIGQATNGNSFEVTGISGEWYVVNYDSKAAYIHRDFLSGEFLKHLHLSDVGQSVASVAVPVVQATASVAASLTGGQREYIVVTAQTGVNFRVAPAQDKDVIFVIPSGEAAALLETQGEWYKIAYNGREGFIFSSFAEKRFGQTPDPMKDPIMPMAVIPVSKLAQDITDYAKQFIGTPYRFGGTDLRTGVDCSGFTFSVFKHFGIELHRVSRDQINNGPRVERNNLQVGDLVFFNVGGNSVISHVGIYIGNSQFIHSGSTRNIGVIISSLNEDYYNRMYVGAARVLQ